MLNVSGGSGVDYGPMLNVSGGNNSVASPERPKCSELNLAMKTTSNSVGNLSLMIPAGLNLLQLVAAVTFLGCVTRSRRAKDVLVPKTTAQEKRSRSPIDWFRSAYAVDMERSICIDGRVVVRLCLLGIKFSAAGCVGGAVLMVAYSQAGDIMQGQMKYTISNLTQGHEHVLWMFVATAYYCTAVFIWLMRAEWRYFVAARHKHFVERAKGTYGPSAAQAQCSLLIENVSDNVQNAQILHEFFSRLFDVYNCTLQRDTQTLYHLKALKASTEKVVLCTCCRASVDRQIERIIDIESKLIHHARRAEGTLQGLAMEGPLEVEEIAAMFSSRKSGRGSQKRHSLGNPQDRSEEESELEPGSQLNPTTTAFVTLKRASERVISQQALLFNFSSDSVSAQGNQLIVKPAPEARDVIWQNAATPDSQMRLRIKIGHLLCALAVLLWSAPITAINTITSEANLRVWFEPQVNYMQEHYLSIYKIAVGYLPVLALMLLILLLPYVLRILARSFELRKTKTDIARSVFWRNFLFQFFSLWLTVFSSSLMDSFRQILDHPPCVSTILGLSIPKVSSYFTSFVIARIGISLPLLLLRLPAVISLVSGRKPPPVYCVFETEATNIVIVFVIGSMYCVVAPIVTIACLIYFILAFLVYKWLFVHVYETEFDCAGELWLPIFDGLVVGMLFGMFSICGLAGMYGGPYSIAVWMTWLVPIFLIAFWVDCKNSFARISQFMPYQDAIELDRSGGINVDAFKPDCYLDPVLKAASDCAFLEPHNENLLSEIDETDEEHRDQSSDDCQSEASESSGLPRAR